MQALGNAQVVENKGRSSAEIIPDEQTFCQRGASKIPRNMGSFPPTHRSQVSRSAKPEAILHTPHLDDEEVCACERQLQIDSGTFID